MKKDVLYKFWAVLGVLMICAGAAFYIGKLPAIDPAALSFFAFTIIGWNLVLSAYVSILGDEIGNQDKD